MPGPKFLPTSGNDSMEDGYTPRFRQDVCTFGYVEDALQAITGNSSTFVTTDDQIPGGVSGVFFSFRFEATNYGDTSPIALDVTGYAGTGTSRTQGLLWTVDAPTPGTYDMVATLRRTTGGENDTVLDTLSFTWTVATTLVNASIQSVSLSAAAYGQNAQVGILVDGTGPFRFTKISGSLPAGVVLLENQFFTQGQAAQTIVSGTPLQEGSGTTVEIGVIGATSVTASASYTGGINIEREPTFVGLNALPVLPVNTPGRFELGTFVRAFPAVASVSADPALGTLADNLTLTGTAIVWGNLTSLAGQTTTDITFQLESNGIGSAQAFTQRLQVASISVDIPANQVIFSWSRLALSATDGQSISAIADLGQGAALQMKVAEGIGSGTAPTWDSAESALAFRHSARSTLGGTGIDCDIYPHGIAARVKFLSSTALGTRQWYGSSSQFGYFDKGTTGAAAAPTYEGFGTYFKNSLASASTFSFTPSAGASIRGMVLFGGTQASTDYVTSVSMSATGGSVALSRFAFSAQGSRAAWGYFLGSGLPAGSIYNFNVAYTTAHNTNIWMNAIGLQATGDCRILDSKILASAISAYAVTLSYSGVPALGLGTFTTRDSATADVVLSSTLALVDNKRDAFASHYSFRQSAAGSSNFSMALSQSGAQVAVLIGLAIAEATSPTVPQIGIASNQLGQVPVASAIAQYNNILIYHDSPLSSRLRIGSLSAGAMQSLTAASGALTGRMNDFYLGGNTGADFNIQALRVIRGTIDVSGSQGTAHINWLSAQGAGTITPPPSVSTAPQNVVSTGHSLIIGEINPDLLWSEHRANVYAIAGYSGVTSGTSLHNKVLRDNVPESGHMVNGFLDVQKTTRTVPGQGTRNFVRTTVWNTMPNYPRAAGSTLPPSIRMNGACGYSSVITIGTNNWYAFAMFADDSSYLNMTNASGYDLGLIGLHQVTGIGPGETPFSGFIEPVNGTTYSLVFVRRTQPLNQDGTVTQNGKLMEKRASTLISGLTENDYIEVIINFQLGYLTSQGPFWRAWVYKNGVALNSGNPVVNDTGRLGFNLSDQRHEGRLVLGPYLWNGAEGFTMPVNNIPGAGLKGIIWDVRKSIVIRNGTAGGVPVNRDTLLGYLRLVE